MASLIERIRANILEIGRGANEQIDLLWNIGSPTTNPGFRRNSSGSEIWIRGDSRTGFRRIEKATQVYATDVVLVNTQHKKVLLMDTSAAARSVTLPAPENGLHFYVKDAKGNALLNNITIIRNGSEKIDNVAASYVIKQNYQAVCIYSDGTDWYIIQAANEVPYETGTANAAFVTQGGSATINSSVRTINWTRIGRQVFLAGRLDMSSISSPTGYCRITGLPYAAAYDCTVPLGYIVGRSFNSLAQNLYGRIGGATNYITVEDFQDGDASNGSQYLFGSCSFVLGGSYMIQT